MIYLVFITWTISLNYSRHMLLQLLSTLKILYLHMLNTNLASTTWHIAHVQINPLITLFCASGKQCLLWCQPHFLSNLPTPAALYCKFSITFFWKHLVSQPRIIACRIVTLCLHCRIGWSVISFVSLSAGNHASIVSLLSVSLLRG